ncbi:TonB-dependent receptor [Propionivibrio sp.]|uniref:TonB-dependent receptor n=1 Tax=Propionivibrio sp. TaxID=2212460 RepID=UPI003BF1BEF5
MFFAKNPIALAVAFALPAVWQTAIAQSNPAPDPAQTPVMTEVLIKSSKINNVEPNSTRLDAASLVPMRAYTSDTATLLRDVPGVSLYGAGGVSSLPVIHGLADDRIRIKVDGMDLIASCPNHMNSPLSYLDPSSIESLKVYSGISPVSVGGDSIAGTIIAKTRAPEFAVPGEGTLAKGEAGAFYRSNGNAKGGNLSATLASESLSLTYTGATAQSDNYTAGSNFKNYTATGNAGQTLPRDEVGSTAYETRNHTLGLALKGGNHLVEAKFGYQDLPFQNYPNQRMDMTENIQNRLNLRYLGQFDWGALEASAYHEKVNHKMDFGDDKRFWYGAKSGPGGVGGTTSVNGFPCSPLNGPPAPMAQYCAAGMPMETESKNSGFTIKADIALNKQDLLRVGSEFQRYHLDDWWPASGSGMWPGTFQNINDGQRDRTALFGEWESRPNEQWMTSLGARFERVNMDAGDVRGYSTAPGAMGNQYADANAFNARNHERTDNNWDLAALARYTADATRDVEFGFARKVRSPNLYERYTWSTWSMAAVMNNFVGDGNGYIGNLDLQPEIAHTVSATFDLHSASRDWEFKATPYYSQVTDYIDAVRCPAGSACTPPNPTTSNQFVVLQYANQSARLYGLDLSGKIPLAKNGFGEWGLNGLLNYTNGKNRDTGDDIYNIMPLNAKLTLTHNHGGWDSGLELVMVKEKNNVSDVRNEVKTSGYSLVNLRSSYSWKQVRLDFGVDNLFDRGYALPLGGAYTGQGRTMSLNPPATDGMFGWGTAVPGMGRSLYTGLNIKF